MTFVTGGYGCIQARFHPHFLAFHAYAHAVPVDLIPLSAKLKGIIIADPAGFYVTQRCGQIVLLSQRSMNIGWVGWRVREPRIPLGQEVLFEIAVGLLRKYTPDLLPAVLHHAVVFSAAKPGTSERAAPQLVAIWAAPLPIKGAKSSKPYQIFLIKVGLVLSCPENISLRTLTLGRDALAGNNGDVLQEWIDRAKHC